MNNFTEDLTGLSRADLVYKAKLAEQAERCAFRSPACPYHFRQKLQKASSRWPLLGRDWRARVGVPGRAVPVPRPSDALLRGKDTADDSHPSFLGDLANRAAHRGARSGTRSRARDSFSPVVWVPRRAQVVIGTPVARPRRRYATRRRRGGRDPPRIRSSGCSQRRSRASGRDRATSRARSRARPGARPLGFPAGLRYPKIGKISGRPN